MISKISVAGKLNNNVQCIKTGDATHLRVQSYPADLSDSPDLDPGCPGPGAGSPAGSAAASAPLAGDLLVEGTSLLRSGRCAKERRTTLEKAVPDDDGVDYRSDPLILESRAAALPACCYGCCQPQGGALCPPGPASVARAPAQGQRPDPGSLRQVW